MKLFKSALFHLLYTAVVLAVDISQDKIKEEVGDGGSNTVSFSISYANDSETVCFPCAFCEGSSVNSLFNPKGPSVCIACGSDENSCNQMVVTTSFKTPCVMKYTSFTSHDGEESYDPDTISVQASEDYNAGSMTETWSTLMSSSSASVFKERNTLQDVILDNDTSYNHYRVLFRLKDGSSKMKVMKLGHYGLIQAYLKTYSVQLYEKITNQKVLGLPSFDLTANWVRGTKGATCDQTCNPLGKSCNSEKQTELNTYDKMKALMELMDYTCTLYMSRSYVGVPCVLSTTCFYFGGDSRGYPDNGGKSSCTANQFSNHEPLCYCD